MQGRPGASSLATREVARSRLAIDRVATGACSIDYLVAVVRAFSRRLPGRIGHPQPIEDSIMEPRTDHTEAAARWSFGGIVGWSRIARN